MNKADRLEHCAVEAIKELSKYFGSVIIPDTLPPAVERKITKQGFRLDKLEHGAVRIVY